MFEISINKAVKVFSQLYVGVKPSMDIQWDGKKYAEVTTDSPLAFATPLEKNQAGLKRQETVNTWLKSSRLRLDEAGEAVLDSRGCRVYDDVEPDVRIIENVPRSGFKITDDVKRVYFGGGNVVFRVYDPNGFELEIQSSNLMALIQVSGINEGGVIPGQCVWGRDGKNNILLHEKSEEYKSAIMMAENAKSPPQVPKSQRVAGSKYLLQDGTECIYLGNVFAAAEISTVARGRTVPLACGVTAVNTEAKYCELQNAVEYDAVVTLINDVKFITLYKKAPLIRLVEQSSMNKDELEKVISEVKRGNISTASGRFTGRIVFVGLNKPADIKYELIKAPENVFEMRKQECFNSQMSFIRNQVYTNMDHFLSGYCFKFFLVSDSVDSLTPLNSPWYNIGIIEKRVGWTDQGNSPEKFFGRGFIDNKIISTYDDNYRQSYYDQQPQLHRCAASAEKTPILADQTAALNFLNKKFNEGKLLIPSVVDTEGKVKNLISLI